MTARAGNLSFKVILCLAFFLSVVPPVNRAMADYVRIKGTVVNVRQGPGTTYQVLFQAKQGNEFDLLKTEGLWCLISLEQGEEAWVFGRLVEILPGERSSKTAQQSSPEVDQPRQSRWTNYLDILFLVTVLFLIVIVFWRKRQILDVAQRKLREVSGYRREQPFRYDNRNPKDDRWEL